MSTSNLLSLTQVQTALRAYEHKFLGGARELESRRFLNGIASAAPWTQFRGGVAGVSMPPKEHLDAMRRTRAAPIAALRHVKLGVDPQTITSNERRRESMDRIEKQIRAIFAQMESDSAAYSARVQENMQKMRELESAYNRARMPDERPPNRSVNSGRGPVPDPPRFDHHDNSPSASLEDS